MCLASEEDSMPCVQQWDVRYATAPVLQLDGHQKYVRMAQRFSRPRRGIMAMSWCPADAELLLTCGKDQKLYLWNPLTGAFHTEIPNASRNWPNECHWFVVNQ